ncbi:MAG TPA: EamA family transporter [Hyphomicrobiaceae bacterium]|nr:EamA family transporter [Hyphomicrobiaceae bacterium]
MDGIVFLAVLGAALCHAGWNALLKLDLEPLLAITLISVACGVVAIPMLPFAGLLHPSAWPYIAGSLALHLVYYTALAEAYKTGDLGQVYPIARGSAPLMTSIGAAFILDERLGPVGWSGIVLLASGILTLSLGGARSLPANPRTVGFALLTAVSIALYTLVDGAGVRTSQNVAAYVAWLFFLDGLMMAVFGYWYARQRFIEAARAKWRLVAFGGVLSTLAYAIALWAMTRAPIGLVAALRETSVLFAAAIGIVFLGERLSRARIIAALLVVAGLMLIRLK